MPRLAADPPSPLLTWQGISALNRTRNGITGNEEHPAESKEVTDMDRALVASRSTDREILPSLGTCQL